MIIRKASFVVAFVVVIGTLSSACKKRSDCEGLTSPSCGGGGNTAQVQNIEVDAPNGSVIVPPPGNSSGSVPVTFWFSSDLPDSEYVDIETAMSNKKDVLTDGFGGKWVKTVGEWKKGNPNSVSVGAGSITRKDTTFHYIHIMAFRGFGPDIHPPGGVIPISALGNMLAHEVIEREITILFQLF